MYPIFSSLFSIIFFITKPPLVELKAGPWGANSSMELSLLKVWALKKIIAQYHNI